MDEEAVSKQREADCGKGRGGVLGGGALASLDMTVTTSSVSLTL